MRHGETASPISWLDLDEAEGRYLLSASSAASVAIFDTQQEEGTKKPIAFIPRSTGLQTAGHRFSVTTCQWFPADTGLFVTASDVEVRLYDTSTLLPVCIFKCQGKATSAKISRAISDSCLIAAGSFGCNLVRLGDPRTGAFTHTLIGHNGPVLSLDWSRCNPHEIMSGDLAGQIKVWDIRRPSALHTLDQNSTQRHEADVKGEKRPKLESLSHQGPVFSLAPHPNHLMWLSCGKDQRMMLWETRGNRSPWNRLVNFPIIPSTPQPGQHKTRQLLISPCGQTVFVPVLSGTLVLHVLTGRLIRNLKVQGVATHALAYSPLDPSLYQGMEDGSIIKWHKNNQ